MSVPVAFETLYEDVLEALLTLFQKNDYVSYLSPEEHGYLVCFDNENSFGERTSDFKGYPSNPMVCQLARFFTSIMLTGTCPIMQIPVNKIFDESKYLGQREENIKLVRQQLQGALTLWSSWTDEQRVYMFANVMERLRRRGLLDMLQMRKTPGTVDLLPLPRAKLIQACTERYSDSVDRLTVCGRAFTKHCPRDSTKWWGEVSGNDEQKNKDALALVEKILDNATWINAHHLPGSIPTLEIRTSEGYGLRFDYSPLKFRGFLEPYYADGVKIGFKH